MNTHTTSPFYQKLSFNLITISILCLGFIYGSELILPILFSILVANLLLPVTNFLARKKFPKILTILIPLILTIVIGLSIIYFLSNKIIHFVDDLPAIKERLSEVSHSFQEWFKESTNMTISAQNKYIDKTVGELKEKAPNLVGQTVGSLTGILSYVVLMPIYTFLILFYRSTIKTFLINVFANGSDKRVHAVLSESTTVAQQYLTGLFIETVIVFTLNSIGFLVLGVKYGIFLALLAALLNLIPYVGIIVANVICMLITLVSSPDLSDVLWVGVILAVVQFFDNNFGMPMIVGNKVRINALVTIIGVLIGGALCGIPGMFLAIPGLAILKVIFDKVPELQPWGLLLGDTESSTPIDKLKEKKI